MATDSFAAYVVSKAYDLDPSITRRKRLTEAYLAGQAAAVTIKQTVFKDWATESLTDTVSLAAVASEMRVRRRFEAVDIADAIVLQIQLGDAAAAAGVARWVIDRWVGVIEPEEGAK